MSFHHIGKIFRNTKQCGPSRKISIYEAKNKGTDDLYEVIIKGFEDNDAFLVKFDEKKNLTPYHSDGAHQKACDAVIICLFKENPYIIFIELKSSSINLDDIEKKFKSSWCFIDYSSSILKRFDDDNTINHTEKRFIVIRKPVPLGKLPTRHVFEDGKNNPSNPKIIPYENKPVPISKLINIL